jgi:hypothetical protein
MVDAFPSIGTSKASQMFEVKTEIQPVISTRERLTHSLNVNELAGRSCGDKRCPPDGADLKT